MLLEKHLLNILEIFDASFFCWDKVLIYSSIFMFSVLSCSFNRSFFAYVVHDLLDMPKLQYIRFSDYDSSINDFAVWVDNFFSR